MTAITIVNILNANFCCYSGVDTKNTNKICPFELYVNNVCLMSQSIIICTV